ncbi:MAG: methionyl-tRNA formyltransferase [Alphaproteobacteria bacterium]|nr:methionyl-tRNA formyltransferase [Alphaproteobacteria bacterium]
MDTAARKRTLDLVFMGTPPFAATVLEALIAAGHRILGVYTQPPRPAGRGHRLQPSPVQSLAAAHGFSIHAPETLQREQAHSDFRALGADAAVVAAYGLILPRPILEAPRFGCLNVHASLLPRWRGAAPIQRALLAGDRVTGITIMQMEEGLDTGPILMKQEVPIAREATAAGLSADLAMLGGRLIVATLDAISRGVASFRPQPQDGITYARKIRREEGRLDWRLASTDLDRRVRAFDPWPGAYFEIGGERIRVHAAAELPGPAGGLPGTVLDDRLTIACGEGALRLARLQRAGRAPLDAPAFLRGYPIAPGTVLPCPATS